LPTWYVLMAVRAAPLVTPAGLPTITSWPARWASDIRASTSSAGSAGFVGVDVDGLPPEEVDALALGLLAVAEAPADGRSPAGPAQAHSEPITVTATSAETRLRTVPR
jgi:hypothetical protein